MGKFMKRFFETKIPRIDVTKNYVELLIIDHKNDFFRSIKNINIV